jgi:hypothetical protein
LCLGHQDIVAVVHVVVHGIVQVVVQAVVGSGTAVVGSGTAVAVAVAVAVAAAQQVDDSIRQLFGCLVLHRELADTG